MTDFDFSPFDDALLATGAEDGIVSYSVINDATFACKVILYSIGLILKIKIAIKSYGKYRTSAILPLLF